MEQRVAALGDAIDRGEAVIVVHYACENLHTATDHPPAVSAIAVHSVVGSSTMVLSRTEYPTGTDAVDAEIRMLSRFFKHLQSAAGAKIVHWNMSRAQYGFDALASRYRFLTNTEPPYVLVESARFDLDDLVEAEHGEAYANHPKLTTLAQLNGISARYALSGLEEANHFVQGDFAAIDRSVSEKVQWIAQILRLLVAGDLLTLTSAGSLDFAEGQVDAVAVLRTIGRRLRYVERELRKRHSGRVAMEFNDEYDDQDLVRGLLRLFFDDVRPEDCTPSYAGGASRIDFVLPDFGIVVELKHCRSGHTAKSVGEELIIDVARYANHPNARHLVCLVIDYDGQLANPRGLEADLGRVATKDGIAVTVEIVDR